MAALGKEEGMPGAGFTGNKSTVHVTRKQWDHRPSDTLLPSCQCMISAIRLECLQCPSTRVHNNLELLYRVTRLHVSFDGVTGN